MLSLNLRLHTLPYQKVVPFTRNGIIHLKNWKLSTTPDEITNNSHENKNRGNINT